MSEEESEFIPAETWCPDCQGPPLSDRAALVYCVLHMPQSHGNADADINFPVIFAWLAEAGGEHNQRMCDFVHRRPE